MNPIDFLRGITPSLTELLDSVGVPDGVAHTLSININRDNGSLTAYGFSLVPVGSTPAEPESIAPPDPDLPGPTQVQLMALWKAVEDFRDKHEITCSETVHQMDKVAVDATSGIEDFIKIVGFGDYDEETDEYVGARR